jgi:hypothetical protein
VALGSERVIQKAHQLFVLDARGIEGGVIGALLHLLGEPGMVIEIIMEGIRDDPCARAIQTLSEVIKPGA